MNQFRAMGTFVMMTAIFHLLINRKIKFSTVDVSVKARRWTGKPTESHRSYLPFKKYICSPWKSASQHAVNECHSLTFIRTKPLFGVRYRSCFLAAFRRLGNAEAAMTETCFLDDSVVSRCLLTYFVCHVYYFSISLNWGHYSMNCSMSLAST